MNINKYARKTDTKIWKKSDQYVDNMDEIERAETYAKQYFEGDLDEIPNGLEEQD